LHRRLVVAVVAGSCCAFNAHAEGENAVEDTSKMLSTAARDQNKTQGLFGRIALAYLANRGNTDTTNANAELDLGFLAGHWRHAGMVRGTIGSGAGVRTAEDYRGNLQSDYTFSDHNYVFGAIDGSYDRFGAYQRRTSSTIGLGRRFIDTPAQQLDIQAGIGVSRTRRPAEAAEQETVVAGTLKYGWKMSDHGLSRSESPSKPGRATPTARASRRLLPACVAILRCRFHIPCATTPMCRRIA
jgi:putative salt-induced outer membrane protein YdiY